MLTPRYTLAQDADTVTVCVRAPFSRPRDFTISTDGTSFRFHCRPYLLHLSLPHALRPIPDDDPSFPPARASYDLDTGVASITLTKATPGLHFPALSCLSKFLVAHAPAPTLTPPPPPATAISVLSSSPAADSPPPAPAPDCPAPAPAATPLEPTGGSLLASLGALSVSAPTAATRAPEPPANSSTTTPASPTASAPASALGLAPVCYGFGDRYSGVFAARAEDAAEIVDLPDPDATSPLARRGLRIRAETAAFDPEHYAADYMQADDLAGVLAWRAPAGAAADAAPHSAAAQEALLQLPRREYLPDVDAAAAADLAGVVFAALYDLRAGAGERCVESAWTISRLAPALAWLEHAPSAGDAVRAAFARSLVFPLYRSVAVARAVLSDVQRLFDGDADAVRARLLRLLLDVNDVFERAVVLRIFSDIVLTDYCVWVQHVGDDVLRALADDVARVSVSYEDLPWDLRRLERYVEQQHAGATPDDAGPVWHWGGSPCAVVSDEDESASLDSDESESDATSDSDSSDSDASEALSSDSDSCNSEPRRFVPLSPVADDGKVRFEASGDPAGQRPSIIISACDPSLDESEHLGLRPVATSVISNET